VSQIVNRLYAFIYETNHSKSGLGLPSIVAPPDIIDVVDEDDDIIDEEDPIPYDLADFDDEDLVNLDIDDGVNVVNSSEEED
ncbi:hypothetical protein Tco_0293776, partial [Tanacetum coccineum]